MSGNKQYTIEYVEAVLKEDLPRLPKTMLRPVRQAIEERLALDPLKFGKPLRFSLKGHRRLRVGDWRMVYRIEAKLRRVLILAIKHRKEIYR